MTGQQDNSAREREAIVSRVAQFKATQEKFEREREEFFIATLQNARGGPIRAAQENPPFWS